MDFGSFGIGSKSSMKRKVCTSPMNEICANSTSNRMCVYMIHSWSVLTSSPSSKLWANRRLPNQRLPVSLQYPCLTLPKHPTRIHPIHIRTNLTAGSTLLTIITPITLTTPTRQGRQVRVSTLRKEGGVSVELPPLVHLVTLVDRDLCGK